MKFTKQEFFRKIEEGVSSNLSEEKIINNNFCESTACQYCEMFAGKYPEDCKEAFDDYYLKMVRKKKLERLLS